jgi:hypothetical protein
VFVRKLTDSLAWESICFGVNKLGSKSVSFVVLASEHESC